MSGKTTGLSLKVSFDAEDLFYKTWFYKNWAFNCKNQNTKKKLIKKAFKELNISKDEFVRRTKIEIVKEEG